MKLPFLLALLILPGALHPAGARRVSFPSVVTSVSQGRVDWTEWKLLATSEAIPDAGTYGERTLVEQQARTRLGPMVEATARALRISSTQTADDILASDTPLGRVLYRDIGSWETSEARYYTSSKVALDAELDLRSWLRPIVTAEAKAQPLTKPTPREVTGIIIDARGTSLAPAVAPAIYDDALFLLYSVASMSPPQIRERMPIGYVSDPADPRAVRRAGDAPLFLLVESVKDGVDIILSTDDAGRFRMAAVDPAIAVEGRIVVVMDAGGAP